MAKRKGIVVGLPFYTPEQWKIQKKNSIDDDGFRSYEEWKSEYEEVKKLLKEAGVEVVDVSIDANSMQKYFDDKKLKNISRNRATYIALQVLQLGKKLAGTDDGI